MRQKVFGDSGNLWNLFTQCKSKTRKLQKLSESFAVSQNIFPNILVKSPVKN